MPAKPVLAALIALASLVLGPASAPLQALAAERYPDHPSP
jgi:hypothetical protein